MMKLSRGVDYFFGCCVAADTGDKAYADTATVDSSGVLIVLAIPRLVDESDESLFDRVADITADYWVSPDQLRGGSHE